MRVLFHIDQKVSTIWNKMDSGSLVWTKQWQRKSSFSLPMAGCSVAGLDLLEIKTYGGQRHLGTPVALPLYNRNL